MMWNDLIPSLQPATQTRPPSWKSAGASSWHPTDRLRPQQSVTPPQPQPTWPSKSCLCRRHSHVSTNYVFTWHRFFSLATSFTIAGGFLLYTVAIFVKATYSSGKDDSRRWQGFWWGGIGVLSGCSGCSRRWRDCAALLKGGLIA